MKMTGKEMTEAFFTKVKKWEWKEIEDALPNNYCWHDPDGRERGAELPAIDTSLDLFWEWVFPEVAKRLEEETVEWFSGVPFEMGKEDYVQSLLKAFLKALGVI